MTSIFSGTNFTLNQNTSPTRITTPSAFFFSKSLSFWSNICDPFFLQRQHLRTNTNKKHFCLRVVCEDAPKKRSSRERSHMRDEKRRAFNRAFKNEIKQRSRKILKYLEELKQNPDAKKEDLLPIEKLISKAYAVIDIAVKEGVLHRNTGNRRKSKLGRRRTKVSIHHGWYVPPPIDGNTPAKEIIPHPVNEDILAFSKKYDDDDDSYDDDGNVDDEEEGISMADIDEEGGGGHDNDDDEDEEEEET